MEGSETGKSTGKIDLVVATDEDGKLDWHGLEIQAVYFSGQGMQSQFEKLRNDSEKGTPFPNAVDRPFFEAIGGPSPEPSQDLSDGDVIWMVPELVRQSDGGFVLERGHWEVLTLENSENKLLAAKTIRKDIFEDMLREKLEPIELVKHLG